MGRNSSGTESGIMWYRIETPTAVGGVRVNSFGFVVEAAPYFYSRLVGKHISEALKIKGWKVEKWED
jgi:hypothetical protein